MKENKKYYFSIVKSLSILVLMMYYVYLSKESLHQISMEWFLLAVIMASAIGLELAGENRNFRGINSRLIFLGLEIVFTLMIILFFKNNEIGLLLLPMVVLDTITFFHLPFTYCLLSFLGLFLRPQDIPVYLSYCCFIIILYYQHYMVIEKYQKYLEDFETEEYRLKDSIHEKDNHYKEELEKSSLSYENKMLEEKARLSQALHDKLGHSINGSIYQLEACKVLMEKEPRESEKIIQAVIDNLRTSMDEIRIILRKEKPNKKQLAILQLNRLCEECKTKYGILVDLKIEGENKEISELIWDIILDNTIEAVTNALKYSTCTRITIEIAILHKVVRCTISDNGIGCNLIKEGMGIQGMKNRARKVNGFVDINGENGFRINMIIPI